ncbi:unnamed protein product, partial [Ixodes persulcatus]
TPEDDGAITEAPLSFVIKKELPDYDVPVEDFKKLEETNSRDGRRVFPPAIRSRLSKQRVSCSVCHKHLANRTTLQKHLRIHTDERPFKCEHCQRRFRQKEHCEKHGRIHSQGNGYECLVCTMTFGRRHFLAKHMLVCHNTDIFAHPSLAAQVRRPPAPELKANFLQAGPVKTSNPVTLNSCGVCGKVFRQRYNLKRHMRTQHEEPSNVCMVCAKVFKRASGLKTHKLTHAGLKPFRCGLCARCFTQKHHLIRHQLVHLPKVNIVCSICRKGFRYASGFFEHMAVHEARNEARGKPALGAEMICYGTPGATLHRSPHFQSQFVLFDPSDMKCMFCDATLPSPESLHDHLVDHCEQIAPESAGFFRWNSGDADEILGL